MSDPVNSFPIRDDITVLPADDPKKLRLGWVIHEEVGYVAVNDYAISRIGIDGKFSWWDDVEYDENRHLDDHVGM